jgi:hypothetical protein
MIVRGLTSRCDGPVGLARAPVEHDRVGEEDDRHEEVRHHERGREVEQHGEPAEHGLREHARDQTE